MREPKVSLALAGLLLLVAVSACSAGTAGKAGKERPARAREPVGTAWASAHRKALGGLHGRFRSAVVTRACTQPPTKPCAVGGAANVDAGSFTLYQKSVDYVHTAFGNGADVTELTGYRVRTTTDYAEYYQAIGHRNGTGCWTKVENRTSFGSQWADPPGFEVIDNAEPDNDPPAGRGASELVAQAEARIVLTFLGLEDLEFSDDYLAEYQKVPVHLRIDEHGYAAGFWVDGEEVATALVGPAPSPEGSTNPAFLPVKDDKVRNARVRQVLTPVHGEFTMSGFTGDATVVRAPRAC
jgi:hypothetical protein